MWVVLLLRGGVSPKLFTFHLISCTTDCKTKLFSTASVKNVSETLKITVTVLNCLIADDVSGVETDAARILFALIYT